VQRLWIEQQARHFEATGQREVVELPVELGSSGPALEWQSCVHSCHNELAHQVHRGTRQLVVRN